MRVSIDPDSGFCFGVSEAVHAAETALAQEQPLYCLGEIVHNAAEQERLVRRGLLIISHEQFRSLRNTRVLIRAHGEPPATYRLARENGIELIDASCPIVRTLQKRVARAAREMKEKDGLVILFGKADHPEVTGLTGHADGPVRVARYESDLEGIDFSRPVSLFSQTTLGREEYERFAALVREKISNATGGSDETLTVTNSVCRKVSGRADSLARFAGDHDVVIFVSGKNSSNGAILAEICKRYNPRTYRVSGPEELDPRWFREATSVGISGATSTPQWLMEEVATSIGKMRDGNTPTETDANRV